MVGASIQTRKTPIQRLSHRLPTCGQSDTLKLNRVAQQTLTQIYRSGYTYKKCGVVLMGIESATTQMQLDWLNPPDSDKRKSLMHTIDALNQRFGRHSIRTADQDAAGNCRLVHEARAIVTMLHHAICAVVASELNFL